MMKYDCCCIGRSCVDYIALIKKYPEIDTKIPLLTYEKCIGGQAANAAVVLSKLGTKTLLVTPLGDDELAKFIKEKLDKYKNLKTIYIALKNLKTPSAFIWAEKKSGKRTIVYEKIYQNITYPADIIEKSIKNSSFVLFDHQSCKDIYNVSSLLKKYKVKLVMDAERKDNYMFKMLPHINFFVCSKELAKSLKMPVKKLLKKFINMGPEIVCCTLGEKGCVAVVKGENRLYYQSAIQVASLDTTGAGDVFHAGFIYGLLRCWKIENTLKFANKLAGISTKYIGGSSFIKNIDIKAIL